MNAEQDALFEENAGRTARLLVYGIIAIVMMAADHRGHYLARFRDWGAHVVLPIYELIGLPFRGMEHAGAFLNRQSDLQNQLQQLQQENLQLRAQVLLTEKLRQDNNQLRELLGATQQRDLQVVYTELVRIDLDPYSHRVVIDRGANDGIAVGQAVMDANGVFGQVELVSHNGAEVILISDPNHALPVQISRTGMRTLAYGTGKADQLVLPDLPINTDIRPGDQIVTSGLGGRFNAGLPVATVETVDDTHQGDFTSAHARPLAGLDHSANLLVILQPQSTDAEDLAEEDEANQGNPEGAREGDGSMTNATAVTTESNGEQAP